jgi:hypothetical protein
MKNTMKKAILFLLLISSVGANAQKLKDALFKGHLKVDSNNVVRTTDDLSTKIDTTTKKKEAEKPKVVIATRDSTGNINTTDSALAITDTDDEETDVAVVTNNAPVKNNNQVWKEYMDSLVKAVETEVMGSKNIKKQTYYLQVNYEIETTGEVVNISVVSTPENSYLQQQFKERLLLTAPNLSPVLDSTNKPRSVKRRYNFSVTKD